MYKDYVSIVEFQATMDSDYTNRIDLALERIRVKYENLFALYSVNWANRLSESALSASDNQVKSTLKDISKDYAFKPLDLKQGAALFDSFQAATAQSASLFKTIPDRFHGKVQNAVLQSIVEGKGLQDLKPFFKKFATSERNYAHNRAMDQTRKAFNSLSLQRMKDAGITRFEWLHTGGGKEPRKLHQHLSGKVFDIDNPPFIGVMYGQDIYGYPSQLPNCFPGSTKVSLSNGCRNILRHIYQGDMINLVIKGDVIQVTPNHPIMTQRGWLAANEIQEGDYLVSSADNSERGINKDINEMTTTFDDLYISSAISNVKSLSGAEFNLHGYIPKGNVDSIIIDNKLPLWIESISEKDIEKLVLSFANSNVSNIFGGVFSKIINPLLSRFFSYFSKTFGVKLSKSNSISLASVSNSYAVINTDRINSLPRASIFISESKSALPFIVSICNYFRLASSKLRASVLRGFKAESIKQFCSKFFSANFIVGGKTNKSRAIAYSLNRVEKKFISEFSGHVYTIESYNGWYNIASTGIIVKNCRCRMKGVLPDLD